jgi:phosphate transport system permease protein
VSVAGFDPTAPLIASGNLRRRHLVNRVAESGAIAAAVLAVGVLGIVVYSVLAHGASALNLDFLIKDPSITGVGGGMAPAFVGTIVLVLLATLIAMPIGVLVALYLTEFGGGRMAGPIRMALDLLNGLPSIIIGLFVFGLLVAGHGQSGYAGSAGLAIIMLPLIARGSEEVLLLVPNGMREAAEALGISRWRTVVGIVLPTALGGIVTATVLAVARAAGETAPLLLCCSIFGNTVTLDPFGGTVPNVPVQIYSLSEQPDPSAIATCWAMAFVLLSVILFASLGARALLVRNRKRLSV